MMLAVYALFHFLWSLQFRNNERDGISNHQPNHCLLNRLFRRRSMKTSKLHITDLCVGNSPVTGEFPAQMASMRKQFPFDDVIVLHFVSFCCDFTVRTSTHIIRITPQANVICPVIGKQPWWLRADKWYESIKNCKYNPNKAKWYKCMDGHIGGKRDVNAVRQHLELDASFALIHRYFNGCTAFR